MMIEGEITGTHHDLEVVLDPTKEEVTTEEATLLVEENSHVPRSEIVQENHHMKDTEPVAPTAKSEVSETIIGDCQLKVQTRHIWTARKLNQHFGCLLKSI